ncbi:MAG: MarR family winged helix-turn-helix transcriptional regulator [Frankia sp.]
MNSRTTGARRAKSARRAKDSAAALYGLLSAVVRGAARDMGLTSQATLATLERTGPRRITDLAVVQGVTQPSMTVLVTALERSGYVERHKDPVDKRVTLVELTAAGSAYMNDRREEGREFIAQLINKLPPEEAAALTAAIPALTHLLDLDHQQREWSVAVR